jgi:GNAT superfamily N-acetyltransferase
MIVNDLYVAPGARRRGLGRALIGAIASEALQAGGSFLWWDADHGDELAQAFHRSLGAVEEPTVSFLLGGTTFLRHAVRG